VIAEEIRPRHHRAGFINIHDQRVKPIFRQHKLFTVIPSEAELPFFGNSAQSRDLVSSLTMLNQNFLSD